MNIKLRKELVRIANTDKELRSDYRDLMQAAADALVIDDIRKQEIDKFKEERDHHILQHDNAVTKLTELHQQHKQDKEAFLKKDTDLKTKHSKIKEENDKLLLGNPKDLATWYYNTHGPKATEFLLSAFADILEV